MACLASPGTVRSRQSRPRLVVRNVRAKQVELKGEHRLLKFQVPRQTAFPLDAVWWDALDVRTMPSERSVDLYRELVKHRYKGNCRLQLQVSDARQS